MTKSNRNKTSTMETLFKGNDDFWKDTPETEKEYQKIRDWNDTNGEMPYTDVEW